METKKTDFATDARKRKVFKLAGAIDEALTGHGIGTHSAQAAEVVATMGPEQWASATKAAKVNPPSDETKALLIAFYAGRVEDSKKVFRASLADFEAAVAEARANALPGADRGTANPPSPTAAVPGNLSDGRSSSGAAIGEMLAPFSRGGAR